MSPVELRRILSEWRLRVQRVRDILQPPTWDETEWRRFSQALALLVRDHGRSWIIDPNVYWDLRWKLQDGGDLVCQVEHIPGQKTSLVVAQTGGFAAEAGSYTWLWAEFDLEGNFSRDPYWVDGAWKDALTTLLLPFDRQSSYLLAGRTETPDSLLLQEGARPNDGQYHLALPAAYAETNGAISPQELSPAPAAESAPPQEPAAPAAPMPTPTPDWHPGQHDPAYTTETPPAPAAAENAPVSLEPENGASAFTQNLPPARPPNGTAARYWRKRAQLRQHRSAKKIQPRSYYNQLIIKTSIPGQ